MRSPSNDAELRALVERYVRPGRRYLKLGGGVLRMPEPEYGQFVRSLGDDARLITQGDIGVLLEGGWRERRTAAWLIAVGHRTDFRERLGELLLASQVCCTGLAYCVALASFGTPRDAELLADYLDRYLRRPDLGYDQPIVMSALAFTALNLGSDDTARFLKPDGLWERWVHDAPHIQSNTDPVHHLSLMRRLRAFVDECAETA
ncbi:DUF6000 family protein [Streptomyces sp. NPDC093111]|uniref:DUF6000 family protein n=1 Tax=Streptomyces sp. NPDC093111 TaxID=3154978 RepID=UPI0034181290